MVLLLPLVLLHTATAAVPTDEVDGPSLPGYKRAFPHGSRHYSGYIRTYYPGRNVKVYTHYHLALHEDPTAPVLQWQQGGPGGSSLLGLFTENGPLTLNDASWKDDALEVFDNEHTWANAAGGVSLLYIEHPAPTGFSYCEPACVHDDDSQADLHLAILDEFFGNMYPELRKNRYIISGESYAGVLVPTLAERILKRRSPGANVAPDSLEGFALGNDCPGNKVYTCTPYSGWAGTKISLDFLYGHGMIPDIIKERVDEVCADWYVSEPPGPQTPPPTQCADALEDPIRPLKSTAGDTYDMGGGYFLYDTCGADLLALSADGAARHLQTTQRRSRASTQGRAPTRPTNERIANAYALDSGEYACGQENAATAWLRRSDVQTALHVRSTPDFSLSTNLEYNFTAASLLETYKERLAPNFRILQYSGDADPCVPMPGTQKWIRSLALPETTPWHPWTAPGTAAITGYATAYEPDFTFASIRDAGHMSPRYKPRELFYMIDAWLRKEPL